MAYKIYQSRFKIWPSTNKHSDICQRLLKFCQSGEISPDLITLPKCHHCDQTDLQSNQSPVSSGPRTHSAQARNCHPYQSPLNRKMRRDSIAWKSDKLQFVELTLSKQGRIKEDCILQNGFRSKKVLAWREPWSSGYGRRLMFRRWWVRIPSPYTGWTFFHFNLL